MMLILKIVLQLGTLIGTCLVAALDYSWRDKRTSIFKKGRFWLYITLLILFPISIFVTILDEQEKKREIEERDNKIAELSKISKWGITVANRAYISVDHMQFSTPLEANKPIALIFEFVNDGNSPAEITGSATYYLDPNLQQCEYNSTPTFKGVVVAPKSPRTHLLIIP